MSFHVIIPARLNSTRFPGKVLADLSGRPLIAFLIERLSRCEEIDEIVLATTVNPEDDQLSLIGRNLGVRVIRGSENDVLPAGKAAHGYLSGAFHTAGANTRAHDDIKQYLYSKNCGKYLSVTKQNLLI